MLFAVRENGMNLELASPGLKDDKNIVLAAVRQNGDALQFASDNLRTDPEVIQSAIKQNPGASQFALKESDINPSEGAVAAAGLFMQRSPDAAPSTTERSTTRPNNYFGSFASMFGF